MKKNKKVKTNIIRLDTRFEEQVANNLKKFAKLNNQTVNKFISNLVENFLNSQDKSYIKKINLNENLANNRKHKFLVYFNDDELTQITNKCENVSLPISTFIRNAAMGKNIINKNDKNIVATLYKLGGLFKHLFTTNNKQNLSKENNQKMNEILNLIYKKIYELKG